MGFLVYRAPPVWLSEHRLDSRIFAGSFSYFSDVITFALWRDDDRVDVGRYCSIAPACLIFGGGNHYIDRATTYPFHAFGAGGPQAYDVKQFAAPCQRTLIGSDVWLGHGVQVMPGAQIGHGSVIGAGSVVAGTIPPYSVAVGNPASVMRQRFPDDIVRRLLDIAWWEWPISRALANLDLLLSSPEDWPDPLELADEEPFRHVSFPISEPLLPRVVRRLILLMGRMSRSRESGPHT